MKLTPCSRACATMRAAVGSSVAPPNIMLPRHSGDTRSPLRPNVRYSIAALSIASIELTPDAVEWPDAESQSLSPAQPHGAVPQLPEHRLDQLWRRPDGLDPPRIGGAPPLDRRQSVPGRLWPEPDGARRDQREPVSDHRHAVA